MGSYIRNIYDLDIYDLAEVGTRNASLGELASQLGLMNLTIPCGFAISYKVIKTIIRFNEIDSKVNELLETTDFDSIKDVSKSSKDIMDFISKSIIPCDIESFLLHHYTRIKLGANDPNKVVLRSSFIEKNLFKKKYSEKPRSFINVTGVDNILKNIKLLIASLYTVPALLERNKLGYSQTEIKLSILVQKMVESDVGESGVAFGLKQKYGLDDVVLVKANYGIGGLIKKELVEPDEYAIHKPTIKYGLRSIFSKSMGRKSLTTMIDKVEENCFKEKDVPTFMQDRYCISDKTALVIAKLVSKVEEFYSLKYGRACKAEVEWALDGPSQKLYIIDARPLRFSAEVSNTVIRSLTASNFNSSNKSAA